MEAKYRSLICFLKKFLKDENIRENELMMKHTTFKTGGPCDIMVFPETEIEFINIVKEVLDKNIPHFILGLGSNLIVKDGGIRGVVINLIKLNRISVFQNIINCESGARLCDISNIAYENSLKGFEFACGIPGTIGGAVVMNAGAYGGEISHVLHKIKIIDLKGEVHVVNRHEIEFGYRKTFIYNKDYIVISCDIILTHGDDQEIKNNIDDFTFRRNLKQPLEYPSAGSIFKRPEGYFAGKLIEDSGLRGYVYKNAMVSEKHCGFIINKSGASSRDILDLIDIVRTRVYDKFGVELELEVKVIGEE